MRTAEERLEVLHSRAHALEKQRNTAVVKGMGGASGAPMVWLVALVTMFGKGSHGITDSGYVGTSLPSESAGGYVLRNLPGRSDRCSDKGKRKVQ